LDFARRGRGFEPVRCRATPFAPGAYRLVRHPMMLGVLVGLWSAPTMDVVRLVLAISMTAYVLAGVRLEERDLVRLFGKQYTQYQRAVPRLLPRRFARRTEGSSLHAPGATIAGEVPSVRPSKETDPS
jgi:hypothetical protein